MKIGIFFGGQSREREISFAGGRTVYDNLNKSIFEAVPIFVDSLGNFILLDWQFIYKGTIRDFYPPVEFLPPGAHGFQVYIESLELEQNQIEELISRVGRKVQPDEFADLFDFAFLALHGPYGEDGSIQGLLEWVGIPYSGSGILPSAIGINKVIQKDYFKKNHFPDPEYRVLSREEWLSNNSQENLYKRLKESIGVPMVIKAPSQGSSIGVGILERDHYPEFQRLVNQAFFITRIQAETWNSFDEHEKRMFLVTLTDIRDGLGFPVLHGDKQIKHPEHLWEYLDEYLKSNSFIELTCLNSEEEIIIESFIKGKEFSCIVIEGPKGPIALPPTEIVKTKDLFDYRSKYLPGVIRKITPINLPEEIIEKIRSECARLNTNLYCHVYARIDGFYAENGHTYLIDPNTTSGMMPSSFFFHQAAEIGLNPSQFLTYIVRTSLQSRILSGKRNHALRKMLEELDREIEKLHEVSDNKVRVGVILGGFSTERHISVESGRNIYQKLSSSKKYKPVPIFLTGDEAEHEMFILPVNILLKDNADDIRDKVSGNDQSAVIEKIKSEATELTKKYVSDHVEKPIPVTYDALKDHIDVAFIALHGRPGEDGAVQTHLEEYDIPYNGSNVESSRITIDKYRTKEILKSNGFSVANQLLVNQSDYENDKETLFRKIESTFDYPLIAKPSDDGCSSAVKKINNHEELDAFSQLLFRDNLELMHEQAEVLSLKNNEEFPIKQYFMVEDLIQSNGAMTFLEITGGLLTHRKDDGQIEYEIFEPSEALAAGEVLSLEEKFLAGEGQNITPARFSNDEAEQARISSIVRSDLEKIARILKIEGYARIDAFVRIYQDGKVETVVIEANSLPGMTPATCIFHQTAINGYKPYDFIDRILQYALESKKLKTEVES